MNTELSARYRFGESGRTGLLLGLSLRQSLPLIVGVLWLTLWLMAQLPLLGMIGPLVGAVVAFGRWRRAPLFEVVAPGTALVWRRRRRRNVWTRTSLLGAGPGFEDQLPPALRGLELIGVEADWFGVQRSVGVVRDRRAGTLSIVVVVSATGFPVASSREQDAMVASWGAALSPLARARGVVSRVTWQEWAHPVGVAGHRDFLAASKLASAGGAGADYEELLRSQSPFTIAHETTLTVTVDLKRVRARRMSSRVAAGVEALVDEVRLLSDRLGASGVVAGAPFTTVELTTSIRLRSDPSRSAQLSGWRASLASAVGRGSLEWGPMAVDTDWTTAAVDRSLHRSYWMAAWPMLPVPADWLHPLLTTPGVTRTVTVVMEPVPLARAAAEANRQLTSIESHQTQKERHGFRLTARERRRHADVENRERELAEGHPEFRHVGLVTVTAANADDLDDAGARIEQAAAQSMVDLRLLAARQAEGWVASLPLGRSVRGGAWPA